MPQVDGNVAGVCLVDQQSGADGAARVVNGQLAGHGDAAARFKVHFRDAIVEEKTMSDHNKLRRRRYRVNNPLLIVKMVRVEPFSSTVLDFVQEYKKKHLPKQVSRRGGWNCTEITSRFGHKVHSRQVVAKADHSRRIQKMVPL